MPFVSLNFKVHIPYRLQKTGAESAGCCGKYFDDTANRVAVEKFAEESYLPANKILLSLFKKYDGKFKIGLSVSGTALELLQEYRPDVISSFKKLAGTGCVDFFSEPYYNSLSWLYSRKEFQRQVEMHHELISKVFAVEPTIFRNTELIYNNELVKFIAGMGYKGILCEGLDRILNGRTNNQTYAVPGNGDFGVLLRNVRLSDDIAFRFDDPNWNERPLTADKYAGWLHNLNDACNVNLFFDYETFGIHKKADTGIFSFLEHLPGEVLKNEEWKFVTPSEAIDNCYPKDIYDVPLTISWEDKERECCVWSDNMMQNNMLRKIYSIESMVRRSKMPGAMECWGRLQSADHFYYMCENGRLVNDTYQSMNPFSCAMEAYENYRNVVADFEIKLIQRGLADIKASQKSVYAGTQYSAIF